MLALRVRKRCINQEDAHSRAYITPEADRRAQYTDLDKCIAQRTNVAGTIVEKRDLDHAHCRIQGATRAVFHVCDVNQQ